MLLLLYWFQQVAEKRPSTALSSPLVIASRSGLRGSVLGVSGALCLSVFEQPANMISFTVLLVREKPCRKLLFFL
jgi:hypothetical protein